MSTCNVSTCDKNTWCKWQLDKLNGTNKYKERISLLIWIHSKLKPIFQLLSDDRLLEKCFHGQTQNVNEAFNAGIRCPKNIFVSRPTFEMAINSAVLHFNDGRQGLFAVFQQYGFTGKISISKADKVDRKRASQKLNKSTEIVKKTEKTF